MISRTKQKNEINNMVRMINLIGIMYEKLLAKDEFHGKTVKILMLIVLKN